jgi:hypothetical protein
MLVKKKKKTKMMGQSVLSSFSLCYVCIYHDVLLSITFHSVLLSLLF